MFLNEPQADRMECTDIHFIQINRNLTVKQFICDTGNDFLCSLFRKGRNHNFFRPYLLLLNHVYGSLNQGKSFSRSRASGDKHRAINCLDCFFLCFIRSSKIKHQFPSHLELSMIIVVSYLSNKMGVIRWLHLEYAE